jgi:alpha-N-arabinofuranosidase
MKYFLPGLLFFTNFFYNTNRLLAQKVGSNKEYHVAANGSDKNDGSLSNPFKTIMAAVEEAMPGDTITVHEGTYREQINPLRGGDSEAKRITYRAAKGEIVFIKGSEIIKGWTKEANDIWAVRIPNTFFGTFNPYKEIIQGDWFNGKGRIHHRGAVYLNDQWLMEAASYNDLTKDIDPKNLLWFSKIEGDTTIIMAQFANVNPNNATTEINVRPTVFYPDKPFINYITVSGFVMEQAATNWSPPTAEQQGLIGTHWSKGWIIEQNKIYYSKCVGISLGKYGDVNDNKNTQSAIGYIGTINRALSLGWNKGTIGSHIVRNNEVAYCEQSGIVGSMGCAFSIIENNSIHHIFFHRLFTGAEMAAIKFHGAVDVQIIHNCLHDANIGIWLDWMAQGSIIKNNLIFDNDLDIFLEVQHGPILVYNNILLSKTSLSMNSGGVAFAHNLFAGKISVYKYDGRQTPVLKAHSTYVSFLHDNPSGDIKFYNNLFTSGGDVSQYSSALLPVLLNGNIYTRGAVTTNSKIVEGKFGEVNSNTIKQMDEYKAQLATETNFVADSFNTKTSLTTAENKFYVQLELNKNWLNYKRKLITTKVLENTIVSSLPFENPDGTPLSIDKDFLGNKRNLSNPTPGPFEITKNTTTRYLVWGIK